MMTVSKFSLRRDALSAIVEAKNKLRTGRLRSHDGIELSHMITFARGARLYEIQVGQDRQGGGGSKRLVLYVESGQLKRVFFSGNHYRLGGWVEINDF